MRPKQGLRESPFCLVWLDVGNPSHVTHLAAKWGEYTAFGFSRNILARGIGQVRCRGGLRATRRRRAARSGRCGEAGQGASPACRRAAREPHTALLRPLLPCCPQYVYLSSQLGPDCPSISWDDFCRDPYVLGDVCAATAADGRACCKVSADHNYALVAPQSDCFATADGLPAVDWLGRMESLDSDFADLIRLLNGRRGVPRLPAPPARLPRINYHASPCHDSPPADAVMQPEAQAGQQQGQQPAKQPEEEQQPAEKQGEQQAETAKQEDQPADKQEEQPAEAAKQQEQQPTAEKQEEQQAEAGKQGEQPAAEKQPADKQEQKPADKQEEQPAAEKQEGGGRRLAGVPWQARPGTYLPCDAGNYFTAQHAHCAADLLEFFAADVNFFQTLAFRSQRSGMLQ